MVSELVTTAMSRWFASARATLAVVVPPLSAMTCRSDGRRCTMAFAIARFASWNRVSRRATGISRPRSSADTPPCVRTIRFWSARSERSRRAVAGEMPSVSDSSAEADRPALGDEVEDRKHAFGTAP